jgi:myosin heavy subunit
VLFRRKDKDKPTRELDQDPPENIRILDKHRGTSDNADSKRETLDELGVPPPPPLSLQESDSQNPVADDAIDDISKDPVASEYSETHTPEKLKPILPAVHETSEGELPDNYDEHVKELEDLHIIDTSTKKASISSYGSQTPERKMPKAKKVIIPQKDLKKLHDITKKVVGKLEKDMNKQLDTFEKKFKEALRKNADISRANVELTKTSNDLVKENKELLKEKSLLLQNYTKMHDAYTRTLAEQRKNTVFVDNLKTYMEPLKKQEQKIISDNTKISQQAKTVLRQFNTLLEVTKTVDARNQGLSEEMDAIKKNHAVLKEKHSAEIESLQKSLGRIDDLEDDVTMLKANLRRTTDKTEKLENQHVQDAIEHLRKEIKELHEDDVEIENILKKLEEKVSILRDKVNIRTKRK